ncbi:MAG TPA: hypothetical protein VLC92_13945 [Rhodocyclaceae bacterium]|nr:hypothetical protein [Rhodocyclaceae bacterium]
MTRLFRLTACLFTCTLLTACYYPYPYTTTSAPVPASFDRSWDAALGAAADAGIQISSADRATGRITGNKAGAAVEILLLRQADGSLQVSFNAPASRETNPTLSDRWTTGYNYRMGR